MASFALLFTRTGAGCRVEWKDKQQLDLDADGFRVNGQQVQAGRTEPDFGKQTPLVLLSLTDPPNFGDTLEGRGRTEDGLLMEGCTSIDTL